MTWILLITFPTITFPPADLEEDSKIKRGSRTIRTEDQPGEDETDEDQHTQHGTSVTGGWNYQGS